MTTPIKRFTVIPDYTAGANFVWGVSGSLADPAPWTFQVELAEGPDGPWTAISPVLAFTSVWKDPVVRRAGKDQVFFYRLILTTPVTQYRSPTITPYGELNRREYLLVKDIMRREVLHGRTLMGIKADLWLVSTWGPKCTVCLDPITNMITNTDCPVCRGTGHAVPYNGPYTLWLTTTPSKHVTEMAQDGTGIRQPITQEIRTIGALMAKKNDIIAAHGDTRRYYVDDVESIVELRTIPVVQKATIREAPLTDVAYMVGR